jgi:chemotaxis-related protein WspD
MCLRIGDEWLGLATTSIVEVIESRAMHSLPHQANPAVLGLTNIRGTLKICVAMGRMLGMADSTVKTATRALVVEHEQQVLVFPVDEVAGVHGYATASLQPPPSMAQQTGSTYTQAVLSWRDHKVGLLDGGLLFYTLNRSLI